MFSRMGYMALERKFNKMRMTNPPPGVSVENLLRVPESDEAHHLPSRLERDEAADESVSLPVITCHLVSNSHYLHKQPTH